MAKRELCKWMLLIITTALFVFLLPIDKLTSCECPVPVDTYRIINLEETMDRKDIIVHGTEELDRALHKLQELRLRKLSGNRNNMLGKYGWVVDCVTWEKKWKSPLDVQLHELPVNISQLRENKRNGKKRKPVSEMFNKEDRSYKHHSQHGFQTSSPRSKLENALGIIGALHVIITKLKYHLDKSEISLLDVNCDDMQWMSKFLSTRSDITYTGVASTLKIMEHYEQEFVDLPRATFMSFDITDYTLTKGYDLIMCRDLLQYLSNMDTLQALVNMSAKRTGFLLITSTNNTQDIPGRPRFPYNLESSPFWLEPPICNSYDGNIEHMSLWSFPLKRKQRI